MTAPRPFLPRLPGLPFAARRWLVGADSWMDEDGRVHNSGIVRWRYLIAKKPLAADWELFLASVWGEHGPGIVARHKARWPTRASERAYLRRIGIDRVSPDAAETYQRPRQS
jgi:hypothetical protein